MVCPHCMIQMHQHSRVGGGYSGTDDYYTWELKKCPRCSRMYVEEYRAREVSPDDPVIKFASIGDVEYPLDRETIHHHGDKLQEGSNDNKTTI